MLLAIAVGPRPLSFTQSPADDPVRPGNPFIDPKDQMCTYTVNDIGFATHRAVEERFVLRPVKCIDGG